MNEVNNPTNPTPMKSGPYWTIFAAYLLSILGVVTAMSTTVIALILAVAVIFLERKTILESYAWKLIIKNAILLALSIIPFVLFFFNAGNMMHMPVEQVTMWHLLRGALFSLIIGLSVLATIILMIMDTIRLWDLRPKE